MVTLMQPIGCLCAEQVKRCGCSSSSEKKPRLMSPTTIDDQVEEEKTYESDNDYMNEEEPRLYTKHLLESDGFDVPKFNKTFLVGYIIPFLHWEDHIEMYNDYARRALADYNSKNALNAHSRALLMQKLDRSGIASSISGSLGNPMLNGSAPNQQVVSLPINGQVMIPGQALPTQVVTSLASEPVGNPSECLLLKNMFDPATETEPDFDMDIKEEVEEECSNFGRVEHIYVEKNSGGYVYLRFETVEAASKAQRAMHNAWDKHLETWVKASGILGGPKNASPTIISPKQYKRRFRKAMTTYFLTVPDQWSS